MNKMRRNLIKITSCAVFKWFNWSDRFSSSFKVDKRVLMGVPNSQLTNIFSAKYQLTTIFLASSQLVTKLG